jgi:hypothetical protein
VAEQVKEEATDECANDAQNDVHEQAFATASVDDHGADPAGQKADH